MSDHQHTAIEIGCAESRWARVGPYYAMFPMNYVEGMIRKYSNPGDAVLDPFAGRFSVPAVASYMRRVGCGMEISPLGWLYGRVKLAPAQRRSDVLNRLHEMHDASRQYTSEAASMDRFFRMCYCTDVLRFLLACRASLKWKKSVVDATLMAVIMVVLHHGIRRGLSNQIRQPKAMAPRYSVKWWKSRGLEKPPQVDVVKFLSGRINYLYARGVFRYGNSKALLGDSCTILASAEVEKWQQTHGGVKLLFTSPPYWSLVNYFKDQWLRLWMLGGKPSPAVRAHAYEKGFHSKDEYRHLIETVFERSAKMMRKDGIVVVRMDARPFTMQTVLNALDKSFPGHKRAKRGMAVTKGQTQTLLFNNATPPNAGERDLVLVPA